MARKIQAGLAAFLVLQWLSLAEATHFRHGSIMWAPTDSSSNTVRFTFRLAFRRSFSAAYHCDQNTISQGSLIGSGGSWKAKCINMINATNPQCLSPTTIASTAFYCTDYSITEDWSMGENNFTYTFPSIDEEWSVSYDGCCWIPLSRYSHGRWSVSTTLNLTRRHDNGRINSSPISKSAAIVQFQEGCSQSLRIPVEDPDGDIVKCRFASYSESNKNSDSFPYGVLDETSCVLKYGGMKGATGTYAVTLTLEDFPAGTINFGSVKPFSAVGLQFLVIVTGQSGSCNDIPVFTATTPHDGECSEVHVGSAYTAVIEVQVTDVSKQIVEIITSSPAGMQLTPLSYHGGFFYRNVTWYPSQHQTGQQLFCFKAVDSAGLETEMRCVTILVGLSNTPRVIMESRIPRSPISTSGPGFVQLSIQFDRSIKKPHTSAYIRLVLFPSGHTVYKVDTLSQYVILGGNNSTLHFGMPNAAFSMNGSYAILMDKGAVVGQGCSYDGPPTPGIISVSDWHFSVDGVCPFGYYLSPPTFTSCIDIDECEAQGSKSKNSLGRWSSSSTPLATHRYHTISPTAASSSVAANANVTSYFDALANPLDFKLHVPADCEQTCCNTPGSYSCSCVSGYQLDNDGKSCIDTDECSYNNGGCSHHCFNIPGSFYCGCPEGIAMSSNNLTCDDPSVTVTCNHNNMTVTLKKETYHFFKASQMHLSYASCRATENSTHLMISTPLNSCGTLVNETEHVLIFRNEILADKVIIDNVITLSHDIKLPFSCSYSRKTLLSLSFTPRSIYFGEEVGYGKFTFKMDFYKDSSFATPYSDDDYPLDMALHNYMYLGISVESAANLVIMAENCKATKGGNVYSWPQYNIIENGCPSVEVVDYTYDPTRNFQQLKIKAFRFLDNYDTVYVHCELLACHRYSPNSRCSRGCLNSKGRKKRDAKRDKIEHDESTTKVILTRGPLLTKEKQVSDREDSVHNKQTGLVGGVAAAGVFGLIAVIALAVLYVKYRLARRLMTRREPGNQYSTQNEQMGRTNPCINDSNDMFDV